MRRIVRPTSDIFVRFLLGSEDSKDILLDFINAILTDSGFKPAVDLEIRNPFNLRSFLESKESVLDVKAEDESGRIFDVEIQVIGSSRYIKRTLYYWAKNYQEQLTESEDYEKLAPVICVNILDFVLFDDLRQAHTCFLPTEQTSTEFVLTDDFQIHFFELPKMDIEGKTTLSDRLEKWAFFFRKEGQINEENEMKILLKNDPVMEHAHKNYKRFTANDELFEVYEAREKRLKDETSRLNEAREEGLNQGIQKGIQQGMQQGRLEGLFQAAKGMKEAGVAIEIICKTTGLTQEQIENLDR